MNNIMTKQVNINMKLQRRLSVGLAAATLVVALLFFAGSVLLNESYCITQKIDKVLHKEIWSQECKWYS